MRLFGLIVATLCLALLAGIVLHVAGWFRTSPTRLIQNGRHTGLHEDHLTRQAEMRYWQCQPRHWRHCLLQR